MQEKDGHFGGQESLLAIAGHFHIRQKMPVIHEHIGSRVNMLATVEHPHGLRNRASLVVRMSSEKQGDSSMMASRVMTP
jgi:hypothetical protein